MRTRKGNRTITDVGRLPPSVPGSGASSGLDVLAAAAAIVGAAALGQTTGIPNSVTEGPEIEFTRASFFAEEGAVSDPLLTFGYGTLNATALSPDCPLLATGGSEGVFLWEVASGEMIRAYPVPAARIENVAFSPGSDQLLAGGVEAVVERFDPQLLEELQDEWLRRSWLLDLESGGVIRTFEGADQLGFTPDGRSVVIHQSGAFRFWDIDTGRLIHTFDGPRGLDGSSFHIPLAYAFAPDGGTLLTLVTEVHGGDGTEWNVTVKVWEYPEGLLRGTLQGLPRVDRLGFTLDGARIVVDGAGSISFWDTDTLVFLETMDVAEEFPRLEIHTCDQNEMVEVDDLAIRLRDPRSGKITQSFQGHSRAGGNPVLSQDGEYLLVDDFFGPVELWDVRTGRLVRGFEAAHFATDQKRLLSAQSGLEVWDIALHPPDLEYTLPFEGHAADLSRDGSTLVTAGPYDENAPETVVQFSKAETGLLDKVVTLRGLGVDRLKFSPGGDTILLMAVRQGTPGYLHLWNPASGVIQFTLNGNLGIFSPDGSTILTQSASYSYLWDAGDGSLLWQTEGAFMAVEGHGWPIPTWTGDFPSTPFSADGELLVLTQDEEARLVDAGTGQVLRKFRTMSDYFGGTAALSPDGRTVATGTGWGTRYPAARLWDAESGVLMRTVDLGPENKALRVFVAFSPAGRRLITTQHTIVRLWDISDLHVPSIEIKRTKAGLEVTWDRGVLQTANGVNGPWFDAPTAQTPCSVQASGERSFFRVRTDN